MAIFAAPMHWLMQKLDGFRTFRHRLSGCLNHYVLPTAAGKGVERSRYGVQVKRFESHAHGDMICELLAQRIFPEDHILFAEPVPNGGVEPTEVIASLPETAATQRLCANH